jgi:hypothetical protein
MPEWAALRSIVPICVSEYFFFVSVLHSGVLYAHIVAWSPRALTPLHRLWYYITSFCVEHSNVIVAQ